MFNRFSFKIFPSTLMARGVVILLVPMLILQLAVTVFFVQRYYRDITKQLTGNTVREVTLVLSKLEQKTITQVMREDAATLDMTLKQINAHTPTFGRKFYDYAGIFAVSILQENIPNLIDVDLSQENWVNLYIKTQDAILVIRFSRTRIAAINPHQVLVLMMLTGLIMSLIAVLFLRNQLWPIANLAQAASAFGRGYTIPFKPMGAIEVRAAGIAFLNMRRRINRQIEQRTLFLSGVSHDLRTPLTRMQLSLEFIEGAEKEEITRDIKEMQKMIDGFLSYAQSGAQEPLEHTDLVPFVTNITNRFEQNVQFVTLLENCFIYVHPMSISRALENLINNALHYGTRARVNLTTEEPWVKIVICDDGPGILKELHELALKPFVRLEEARNQNTATGVGLGLSIAAAAVKKNGGRLELDTDPDMGGLRASIYLPLQMKGQGPF